MGPGNNNGGRLKEDTPSLIGNEAICIHARECTFLLGIHGIGL